MALLSFLLYASSDVAVLIDSTPLWQQGTINHQSCEPIALLTVCKIWRTTIYVEDYTYIYLFLLVIIVVSKGPKVRVAKIAIYIARDIIMQHDRQIIKPPIIV